MVFLLECDSVRPGLIEGELTVGVKTHRGHTEYFRAAGSDLAPRHGKGYIEVGAIHRDPATKTYLVELPMETDSGAHRIWVPEASLTVHEGMSA